MSNTCRQMFVHRGQSVIDIERKYAPTRRAFPESNFITCHQYPYVSTVQPDAITRLSASEPASRHLPGDRPVQQNKSTIVRRRPFVCAPVARLKMRQYEFAGTIIRLAGCQSKSEACQVVIDSDAILHLLNFGACYSCS